MQYSIDQAHNRNIRCLGYVQTKGWLLSGAADGQVKVWNVLKGLIRDTI